MNLRDVEKIKKLILKLVNEADPWDLISAGAPEDEYNSYVDRIVSIVINKKPDRENLREFLVSLFKTNEFDLNMGIVDKLSERIYDIELGLVLEK